MCWTNQVIHPKRATQNRQGSKNKIKNETLKPVRVLLRMLLEKNEDELTYRSRPVGNVGRSICKGTRHKQGNRRDIQVVSCKANHNADTKKASEKC